MLKDNYKSFYNLHSKEDSSIYTQVGEETYLVYSEKKGCTLGFIKYEKDNIDKKYFYAYTHLREFKFDDINDMHYYIDFQKDRTVFRMYTCLSTFLKIGNSKRPIVKIEVTNSISEYKIFGTTLKINKEYLFNLKKISDGFMGKAKSYKESTYRNLSNNYIRENINEKLKKITTYKNGELDFVIDKIYLDNKEKKDLDKLLSDKDKKSTEKLFFNFLNNDILSKDFLHRLNNYLIKERLEKILKLGNEILSLKSKDLSTKNAIKIIEELDSGEIKSLENLWQKYFEKYLIFLIFTYNEIIPKVKLNIEEEEKFPDFIGINFYNSIDVIEIKHHLLPVLNYDKSHKNFAFSSELSKAIIQTTNYMDGISRNLFEKEEDKTRFKKNNLARPQGIIIISSKTKLATADKIDDKKMEKFERDFAKLRNSIHNIKILTFDELLDSAKNYLKNIEDR